MTKKFKITTTEFEQYPFNVPNNPRATSLEYGIYVEARKSSDDKLICRKFVDADTKFEPETRNNIGRMGAYRDIYPSGEKIAEAIKYIRSRAYRILQKDKT